MLNEVDSSILLDIMLPRSLNNNIHQDKEYNVLHHSHLYMDDMFLLDKLWAILTLSDNRRLLDKFSRQMICLGNNNLSDIPLVYWNLSGSKNLPDM